MVTEQWIAEEKARVTAEFERGYEASKNYKVSKDNRKCKGSWRWAIQA